MATGPEGQAWAFVLGTGRCGSSIIHEVLARHPDVGFVSNLEDRFGLPPAAGRWNSQIYRLLPISWQRKGRLRFAPSEAYRALDRSVSPIISSPVRDLTEGDATPWLRQRTCAFFEARAAAQHKALFLHKLTGWPRSGLLASAFPEARFVHVVRDGRAVASSWLQMPWWRGYGGPQHWQFGPLGPADEQTWERSGRSFVVLAGLAWRMLVDAHAEARQKATAGSWIDVRYEDVVADPIGAHRTLLEHLGLPWSLAFEQDLRRYRFTTGRSTAYRHDLGQEAADQLSAILGSTLAAWGYPT